MTLQGPFCQGDTIPPGTEPLNPLGGRMVDYVNGKDVYDVQCGECQSTDWQLIHARHVDYQVLSDHISRLDVYGEWPRCCEYPFFDPRDGVTPVQPCFIKPSCLSQPVSCLLLARATFVAFCPVMQCNEGGSTGPWDDTFVTGTLAFDGNSGAWVGQIGRMVLTLRCQSGNFFCTIGGCAAKLIDQPQLLCDFPLRLTLQIEAGDPDINQPSADSCCACEDLLPPDGTQAAPTSRITIDIFGYCNRGHPARLVDRVLDLVNNQKDVYEHRECCVPPPCQFRKCCDDNLLCAICATFVELDNGGCSCLDKQTIILFPGAGEDGFPAWQNNQFASCNPPCQMRILLTCLCPGNRKTKFALTIDAQPNCHLQDYIPLIEWDCSIDFDVEFDIFLACNNQCGFPGPNCCCPPGAYHYLVSFKRCSNHPFP